MARAWHLMSRPQGLPTPDNFALKQVDLPPLGPGMVHVRNRWLSVDPYMRGRMNDVKSYVPAFGLDAPMEGGAVAGPAAGKWKPAPIDDPIHEAHLFQHRQRGLGDRASHHQADARLGCETKGRDLRS